ncbi:uncharacterized protein A1O5_10999 [Cladophialophora psammophila CBS 110553]|uniref:Uncharacterized protein n=1 Tax=Cladophialophora psammophila CBS 110553 TaxID=1182543 RepID=W9WCR2_9EURO|nr:uncharacterized protein A1O5_10999 [Cladophialophora psammophila CBS 110553]EXJ65758.1 hypothetical protein A1O5_10999 [Cladophialophora psammophila CBS 110553]
MAMPWHRTLVCLFLHSSLLLAQCPPLGPILPAPTGLSQNPMFQQLVAQVNAQLLNVSSSLNQTAVSVGMRSVHEAGPLLNFHYTPQEFNASGAHKVDGNTVYRVGSVTKVFTALGILQLEGKINLADPVTKYVPKLAGISGSNNSLTAVDWNTVTVEALLTHLGGVPVDLAGGPIEYIPGMAQTMGLPQLSQSQQPPPCGEMPGQAACSLDDFLNHIGSKPPIYRPFTTPVYSNIGYAVLGRIIENVSGQTWADYLEQNIARKAGMNRTTGVDAPASNLGFIPAESNWWGTSLGFLSSDGGAYASNNDILSFGKAILSNTLLDSAQTRKWMKPMTFTSSIGMAVGASWEIVRGPNLTADGRIIDFYAKLGDVGDYSAILALVPDFDLVIAMNFAGPDSDETVGLGIFSQLVQAIIPVVDQIGKSEASAKLAGTYSARPNSSLELSVDDFGVLVSNFSANGVDVAEGYSALNGAADVPTTIRLYPTNLQAGNGSSAWRAVYTVGTAEDAAAVDAQLFFPHGSCQTWLVIDRIEYGWESIDYFVVTEDASGKVVGVEPKAWRLKLERTD